MKNYNSLFRQFPKYAGDSDIPHPLPCEYAASFLKEMKNGVFVDVGAHDGLAWSNSFIFEKLFSWTGLCIEANPSLYEELKTNRDCKFLNCAVDEDEAEQIFWNIVGYASGLGGLEKGFQNDHTERIKQELIFKPESVCEKIPMITRRMDSILARYRISHIDYLSIDVEGNELGVLKGMNFDSCSCTLISVESNDRVSTQNYLRQFGYNLLTKICNDDFYAKP